MVWCCSTNPIMDVRMRMITRSYPSVAGATPFLKHLQFRLHLPISSSSSHQLARVHNPSRYNTLPSRHCDFILSRWFNISWRWTSWMISICSKLLCWGAGVQHLRGEALKKKLNIIIAKHQSLPYKKVWDAIKILDAADFDAPEASSGVVEIYSLRTVSKSLAGKPEGWNREHLWPRSYGLSKGPSLTDLHNIRPADVNVNSSMRNKYYGECCAATNHCLKPATKEAAPDTETDEKRWTPPLQVRGDIARAIMYMTVCYGFPQSDGGVYLQLSDSPNIRNKEMGLLSTLLRWSNIDPPSKEEKLRNERICKLYQHNRNPFVDHPEYANLIWEQFLPSPTSSYTRFIK